MAKSILIVDGVCNKPYDPRVLKEEPLGGTEATVTRIAEALSKNFKVFVSQHNRNSYYDSDGGVEYLPDPIFQSYDYLINLRSRSYLHAFKKVINAKKYIHWLHDLYLQAPSREELYEYGGNTELIAVSDFHRSQVLDKFREAFVSSSPSYLTFPKVTRIYNPIDDSLTSQDKKYDKNKLVFFSSPHKGLERTLLLFYRLLDFNPDFRLYIANPGYFRSHIIEHPNVINIGAKPHHEVMELIKDALCIFYPNCVFPETFGLVGAEANALGVPILSHRFGAALEVFRPEPIDCRDDKQVIDNVMSWHSGNRPEVKANDTFRLSSVIKDWERVLS